MSKVESEKLQALQEACKELLLNQQLALAIICPDCGGKFARANIIRVVCKQCKKEFSVEELLAGHD